MLVLLQLEHHKWKPSVPSYRVPGRLLLSLTAQNSAPVICSQSARWIRFMQLLPIPKFQKKFFQLLIKIIFLLLQYKTKGIKRLPFDTFCFYFSLCIPSISHKYTTSSLYHTFPEISSYYLNKFLYLSGLYPLPAYLLIDLPNLLERLTRIYFCSVQRTS